MTLLPVAPPFFGGGVNTLFFANAGSPYTPAVLRGTWDRFSITERKLAITPVGASSTHNHAESGPNDQVHNDCIARYVTSALQSNITVSGNIKFCIGAQNLSNPGGYNLRSHIWVTTGATDTVRGTLLSNWQGSTEIPATGQGLEQTLAISTVNALAGDYICWEFGWHFSNESGTETLTHWYGNTGVTLLGAGDTNVTTRPAWVLFQNVLLPLAS